MYKINNQIEVSTLTCIKLLQLNDFAIINKDDSVIIIDKRQDDADAVAVYKIYKADVVNKVKDITPLFKIYNHIANSDITEENPYLRSLKEGEKAEAKSIIDTFVYHKAIQRLISEIPSFLLCLEQYLLEKANNPLDLPVDNLN